MSLKPFPILLALGAFLAPAPTRAADPATTTAATTTTAPATTRAAEPEVRVIDIDAGPTRITAKIAEDWADKIFSELARKGAISFKSDPENLLIDPPVIDSKYSAEWKGDPLWTAVMEACETTGLRMSLPQANTPSEPSISLIRLQGGGPSRAPYCVDGPVMVRAQQLTRSASVGYGTHVRQDDQIHFALQVFVEPKLRRCATVGPPTIDRAEDEKGTALPATRPSADALSPGNFTAVPATVEALFGYPAKLGQRIAVLRGSVPVRVAKSLAIVTLPQPLVRTGDVSAAVGPNRIIFKNMRLDASGYALSVSLERGPKETAEHWAVVGRSFGTFGCHIALMNTNGAEIFNHTGGAGSSDTSANQDLAFPPPKPGEGLAEVRVEIPLEFTTLTAKFEFKDLLMP